MTEAPPPSAPLVPARLRWEADQPFSRAYGDMYHAIDGIAEVQRVFVEPQQLGERMAHCRGTFTIGELGFGSALNFAVIAQRHLDSGSPARLHFVSVERHPIAQHEFATLARRRCARLPIYRQLARAYPAALPGWHRRHLAGGRITLSVFFGDGLAGLGDIVDRQQLVVDAWLLDGFAPDRNPELWSDALWRTIARLSGSGTTIATFSAVGDVRRALASVGFSMRKIDQRPHKLHSLAGVFTDARSTEPAADRTYARSVVVIGGGLAGAATARHLADRGVRVTILDASPEPPNRLAATLFHPRLLPDGGQASRLRSHGYLYSSHWYDADHRSVQPTGVLQFPSASLPARRLEEAADQYASSGDWVIAIDAGTASSLAGLPLRHGGLFFPHGRALDLGRTCRDLIEHPSIEYRYGTAALALSSSPECARVTLAKQTLECDHIVLCAGSATNAFAQARYLELLPVWGQIDRIHPDRTPAVPIVGDGFMVPIGSDWGVGATYEHAQWVGNHASEYNLARFDQWWFALTGTHAVRRAGTGACIRGVRAVTSDRMPIVGALFDDHGARVPRVLVNTGHGSQGTVSAPFAAEWIASDVCGEFAPATRLEIEALSSLRFRLRQVRRGLRHGARG
jgi:tRNA 5-methylaminomethyl-2-thiouridine biosynthesis bifunctional protein